MGAGDFKKQGWEWKQEEYNYERQENSKTVTTTGGQRTKDRVISYESITKKEAIEENL